MRFAEFKAVLLSIRRVFGLMTRAQMLRFAMAIGLMIGTGALDCVLPVMGGILVDRVVNGQQVELWSSLAIILGAILGAQACKFGYRYLVENTASRIRRDVMVRTAGHLLRLDLGFFAEKMAGALHGRLNRSIEGVVKLIKVCCSDFLVHVIGAGIALSVIAVECSRSGGRTWLLLAAMLAIYPVSFYVVLRQIASQKGVRIGLLRGKEAIDGAVVELLGGIESVRSMATEEFETKRLSKVSEQLRGRELNHHLRMGGYDALKFANEGFFQVLVLGVAIWLFKDGLLTAGVIVQTMALFAKVVMPLREGHRILDDAHESSIQVRDLFDLLDQPEDRSFAAGKQRDAGREASPALETAANGPSLQPSPLGGEGRMSGETVPAPSRDALLPSTSAYAPDGRLSFDSFSSLDSQLKLSLLAAQGPAVQISGLRFRYANAKTDTVRDVDLLIAPGEFIGVCGPAGCGKSTVLKILLRLLHPASGRVKLFGRELESYSREELAKLVGYVSQVPFLISGTVHENIAYGLEGVPRERVEEAARLANVHDEIAAMADGYDTQVGERGSKLSGGQRQRVALARVFLRSPSLLILDEATAALDNLNEAAVQTAIERAMKGRTVIAVAHRLTTLRNADRILVFDNGEIVQTGTYDSLLAQDGLFARLASASEHGRAAPQPRRRAAVAEIG